MSTFADQLATRPDSHEARQTGIDDRTPTLRKAADGKVDYNYYIRRGRRLRSEAAHSLFRTFAAAVRDAVTGQRLTHRRTHRTGVGSVHAA